MGKYLGMLIGFQLGRRAAGHQPQQRHLLRKLVIVVATVYVLYRLSGMPVWTEWVAIAAVIAVVALRRRGPRGRSGGPSNRSELYPVQSNSGLIPPPWQHDVPQSYQQQDILASYCI